MKKTTHEGRAHLPIRPRTTLILTFVLTLPLLAGTLSAQVFSGQHYTGSVCPSNPNGETNCSYVGNITNDSYSSYAWLTDQTGANFPAINARGVPPTVNTTGPWSGSFTWSNGGGVNGTTVIASGTCTTQGAPVPTATSPHYVSPVVYQVLCSGFDTNGQPVSKNQNYLVYFVGGFWQPPVMGPFGIMSGYTSTAAVNAAPAPPPPDDGSGN